jgi:hypothetical protein
MHSSVWVTLLRHVPAEQHNQLVVVTTTGTEIALQTILRIENEFVIIRGRLAGSQEAGRVFFLPFERIEYLAFQLALKESEFNDLFGTLVIPEMASAPPPAAPTSQAAGAVGDPTPGAIAPSAAGDGVPPPATASDLRGSIKSAVLERFRSRFSTIHAPPRQPGPGQ